MNDSKLRRRAMLKTKWIMANLGYGRPDDILTKFFAGNLKGKLRRSRGWSFTLGYIELGRFYWTELMYRNIYSIK